MVITLTGDNTYLLKFELDTLVAVFVSEHNEFGLERVDGEEAEFARLQEALTTLPLLAAKKMVVMRRPSANKQFTEEAEKLLGDVPETTDVILVEPKLDKRSVYYKYLKKSTDFREFTQQEVSALTHWLVQQAHKQGAEMSLPDAQYLVERVGANQQLLANELEKIVLYNSKVTRESIELLTEALPQSTIFELLEAAFSGNAKHAMQLYHEQRSLKVEPPQVIAMLAWQLHILTLIKTAGERSAEAIAAEARLSPFVVRKSQSIARKLTLSELKTLVQDLLSIDARSKRTELDADEALQNYLLKLAS